MAKDDEDPLTDTDPGYKHMKIDYGTGAVSWKLENVGKVEQRYYVRQNFGEIVNGVIERRQFKLTPTENKLVNPDSLSCYVGEHLHAYSAINFTVTNPQKFEIDFTNSAKFIFSQQIASNPLCPIKAAQIEDEVGALHTLFTPTTLAIPIPNPLELSLPTA